MLKGFTTTIAMLTLCTMLRAQAKSFELNAAGQWQPVDLATTKPVDEPTLDRVDELLRYDRFNAAKSLVIQWLKTHPTSPARDRGLYLTAKALYGYGDRIKAFYYLDELMDEYPASRLYYTALELQYQIADEYLKGYKRRFLGVSMFEAKDEAIEMLYRIQQRSPGSPLAERALLRTANYYYDDRQFDFAADVYSAYARNYPRSPEIPRVRLRQAYASLAQFRGARFDATPLIDSREQLLDMMARYPKLAEEEQLQSLLGQIDESFARKLYYTADFYRRTHVPKAAAYTYRYLIKAYPEAPEAKQAQTQLAKLPESAKDVPEPAVIKGYAPAMATEQPQMR